MTAEFLTADQVAELFQVSVKTVYRHLEDGSLRGAKFGTAWRIRRQDADAWFDQSVPTRDGRRRTATPRRRPAQRGSLRAVIDAGGAA